MEVRESSMCFIREDIQSDTEAEYSEGNRPAASMTNGWRVLKSLRIRERFERRGGRVHIGAHLRRFFHLMKHAQTLAINKDISLFIEKYKWR